MGLFSQMAGKQDQALAQRLQSDPMFAAQFQTAIAAHSGHPDMGNFGKLMPQTAAIFQNMAAAPAPTYSLGANVDPSVASKWNAMTPQQQAGVYQMQQGQGQFGGNGQGFWGGSLLKGLGQKIAGAYGPISMTPGQPAAPMAPPSGQPMAGAPQQPQQPQGYTLGTLAPPQPDPNDPNQQAQVGRSSYGGR